MEYNRGRPASGVRGHTTDKTKRLVLLEPSGVRERNVPHLKGLINANLNPRAEWHDSTFTFCHALLKKAILHHKRALGVQ